MNRRLTRPLALLVALATLCLAACSGSDSPADPTGNDPVVLYVAPERRDCVGAAPQQCLLVRRETDAEWQLFYDTIHGFDYQAGYHWTLEVRISTLANPPIDGSSQRVELLRVLEQTPASDGFELLEVSAAPVPCPAQPGATCLRLRPLGQRHWHPWPGGIHGYQHAPGVAAQLQVSNTRHPEAPRLRRTLVAVLASDNS